MGLKNHLIAGIQIKRSRRGLSNEQCKADHKKLERMTITQLKQLSYSENGSEDHKITKFREVYLLEYDRNNYSSQKCSVDGRNVLAFDTEDKARDAAELNWGGRLIQFEWLDDSCCITDGIGDKRTVMGWITRRKINLKNFL